MFCGWRLIDSKPDLVKFGSGRHTIDVLTGKCFFEGKEIPKLSIAEELRLWLKEDLLSHNITPDALVSAKLNANLTFSAIAWSEKTGNEQFFDHGNPVQTDTMHRCVIECDSEITTDETIYRGKYSDVQEWPIGWPSV